MMPSSGGSMNILFASDLSDRSYRALTRAAQLSQQHESVLTVVHVVDEDLPQAMQDSTRAGATDFLQKQCQALGLKPDQVQLLVTNGVPHRTINELAAERNAELIVLGAHRRQMIKDLFIGTTIERTIRASEHPVLMVNNEPREAYCQVAVALDLSPASPKILLAARNLGFLDQPFAVIHGYTAIAKTLMQYADVKQEAIDRHLVVSHEEVFKRLQALFSTPDLQALQPKWFIEEGAADEVIIDLTRKLGTDLLILGTSGHGGIAKMLLGSVAEKLLRHLERDMLVVPMR